ncbi:MAG: dihydrolipoyl dehydrogenase [Proteobacteria bacterium]|nr:dihydrolipoyl dehydrogenase [Pseudomonadota bacterium]
MAETLKCKVLVVGGGPGGYVAGIKAGQLGLDTILVDGDRLGGTCLIRGCIPSKAIIHAADMFEEMTHASSKDGHVGISLSGPPKLDLGKTVKWKEGIVDRLNNGVGALLKRAKVRVISGWAQFSDAKTCTVGDTTIIAENVILATGSDPVELPHLPFGGDIISSTGALDLPVLPKRLAVVGAGYIGLELGIAYRKLGAEVIVIEAADRILPSYDKQLTNPVAQWLKKNGVEVLTGVKAQGFAKGALKVEGADGKTSEIKADKVLVAVGRKPRTHGWGLEGMGVDMNGRFVKVDDQCRTSMRGVWAIGDLVGEPMLAHKASAQGEMVAEIIAGHKRRFNPVAIPAVCFTEPEIVSVGLGPDDKVNGEVLNASFPWAANGRAMTLEGADDGGFVRVIARKDDHRLLGIQAVGRKVSELSGEFAMALEMGATIEDITGIIHAHPTLSEGFFEAALRTVGHGIHV